MSARDARTATVAVVGDGRLAPGDPRRELAEQVGALIIDRGEVLITGGRAGVMAAACRGARSHPSHRPGQIVAIMPGTDPSQANPFVDTVVCTGMGHGRNALVAQADAVVAIGGGAGTLTEMGMAWIHDRLLVALRVRGWSGRLAGDRLDARVRFAHLPEDRAFAAADVQQVSELLARWMPVYLDARARRGATQEE